MKNSKLLVFGLFMIVHNVVANAEESVFTTAGKNMLTMNVKALAATFMVMPVPSDLQPDQLKFNYKVKDIVVNQIPKASLREDFGRYGEAAIFTAGAILACHLTASVLFSGSDTRVSESVCKSLYLAFLASTAAEKTIDTSNKSRFF